MIIGDRCAAQGIDPQSSKDCHSRPRLKHSRAGYSGNPCGSSLRGELASLEASFPAHAQWIPAFAGMTGWPTGWPRARATNRIGRFTLSTDMLVEAVFMRLSRHALLRRGSPRLATGLGPGKLEGLT